VISAATTDRAEARAERRCRVRLDGPRVNGVRIDPIDRARFLDALSAFVACGSSHVVHFFAAHPTVEARGDLSYRQLLNRGSLNVPDGMPVAWAVRMSGSRTERLAGTDAMHLVASWGLASGIRHYLYGGRPETLGRLRRRLVEGYPEIEVVGAESPPFRPPTDEEVEASVRRMRDAGAQLVWVGLGAPKQDLMGHQLRMLQAAPVILCVGAAFDFVAGTVRRAPIWMQHSGLEWAYRLSTDPQRLWKRYVLGNPRFVAGVLTDRVTAIRSGAGQTDHPDR
jgi:N-acetylglucosaminyldiphosphoundecaprenol N-acetyl-beta-D-mannosaminyltransferase